MLSLPDSVRVFVSRAPVDFRKAHDGLCQIVRDHFGDDPLSGHLFVFTNKRRDRLKILFFDRNGLWLLYKRLERGTFPRFALSWPVGVTREVSHACVVPPAIGNIYWRSPARRGTSVPAVKPNARPC